MSARTERPMSIAGGILSIVVLCIVAVAAWLSDRYKGHGAACRACGRTLPLAPSGRLCGDCSRSAA